MYLQIKIFQFQLYLHYLQSHFHQFRHCQWMWFLCQPSYLSNLKVQGLGAALPFQIHWQSCSSITTKTKEKEMTMMTHCTKTWMKQWFHSRRDHREWEWNCRFHPREPNRASLLPLPTKTACSWVYTQLTWEPKPRPKPISKTFPHLMQVSVVQLRKTDETECKPKPNLHISRTRKMLKPFAETLVCHHGGTPNPHVAILTKIFYINIYLFVSLDNESTSLTLCVGYFFLTPCCLWRSGQDCDLNYLNPSSHSFEPDKY